MTVPIESCVKELRDNLGVFPKDVSYKGVQDDIVAHLEHQRADGRIAELQLALRTLEVDL